MRIATWPFVLSLFLFGTTAIHGASDENELIGHPEIKCNADTIDMQFKTKKQFSGKVYVKGSFNRPECRVDYSSHDKDGRPLGGIKLNHGACNMDRQRMIAPEGMMFSTILIISFHPLFLTRMDKAYHIKCMYKEAARTVTAAIDVRMQYFLNFYTILVLSNLPTESVSSNLAMPTCSYTIRKDQLDGPILRYAKVGDQVVHRWQCDSEEYGVLVHSCYVEDGQGEKQMIVDERGCHTDHLLLGDPTYVEALNMAYRESFVFKFADRIAVRFQCEIRLCLKDDGGCDGITPPLCLYKGPPLDEEIEAKMRKKRSKTFKPRDADMFSQTVYVMDQDGDESTMHEQLRDGESVCFTPTLFTSIVSSVTLLLVFLTSVVGFLAYKRYFSDKSINVVKSFF
ncbi:unnamed protein product [Caenorhabditis auriculariae]|uniref:ZP domain-containing protein n=1 Tax=Caenorhabditis auriculariae TaxID=2777116 RepID=A0A8S1GRJ0_9PELO|nr:unnamed protein product [Caenorhabditis auriculariae]